MASSKAPHSRHLCVSQVDDRALRSTFLRIYEIWEINFARSRKGRGDSYFPCPYLVGASLYIWRFRMTRLVGRRRWRKMAISPLRESGNISNPPTPQNRHFTKPPISLSTRRELVIFSLLGILLRTKMAIRSTFAILRNMRPLNVYKIYVLANAPISSLSFWMARKAESVHPYRRDFRVE